MPAVSEKQRRFMGAELARKRAGKKTKTGMSESKLSEFASKSMDAIDIYLKADNPKLCPFPGCEKGYLNTRIHNLMEHGGKKPIGEGDAPLTRAQFDALSQPTIAGRQKAEEGLVKTDIPDVKINPGERIGGPGDRIQLVPKKSKPKKDNVFVKSLDLIDTYLDIIQPQNDNSFAKSMSLIDIYLFKHARVLPCGHPADEGSEIDKACSVSGCDTSSFTTPRGHTTVNIGTRLTSAPVTDSTTGQATTVGALPGARTHMGRTSFGHTATGGAVSSGGTEYEDVDDFI